MNGSFANRSLRALTARQAARYAAHSDLSRAYVEYASPRLNANAPCGRTIDTDTRGERAGTRDEPIEISCETMPSCSLHLCARYSCRFRSYRFLYQKTVLSSCLGALRIISSTLEESERGLETISHRKTVLRDVVRGQIHLSLVQVVIRHRRARGWFMRIKRREFQVWMASE